MVIALVAVAVIVADRNGWLLVRDSDDLAAYHGKWASVDRVIDGDTIDIDIPDALNKGSRVTRIRLWGIDCPEMPHFDVEEQPWARQAKQRTIDLVEGREVMLTLEPERERDSFGRVLAHVELRDGTCLNEALLEAGLASADDRWPHGRLTRYAQLEWAAKRAKSGIWSDSPAPARPATR